MRRRSDLWKMIFNKQEEEVVKTTTEEVLKKEEEKEIKTGDCIKQEKAT